MMKRSHSGLPFLIGMPIATTAQRDAALAHAEETMGRLRDVVRQLDLPVTSIEQVADIYLSHLHVLVATEQHANEVRISGKVKKLSALRLESDPAEQLKAARQIGGRAFGIGGAGDYMGELIDTDLFDLPETELDAQIAKLST